ncbi:Dynein assembly factor 3 [Phytophthora citrophthora]|uniref:Dynein assembly factor 3 n=1 Tax=Phytophthora citrophthora TaxID=4793 RepID=A0AAD9G4U8_9STRA|nr:Dynein assembly factor 3 [Phytophthora citrophthora]
MARSSSALMSMGTVSMWGFSPAYDVCSGFSEWSKSETGNAAASANSDAGSEEKISAEPINVLLVGPGDVRHVLATIARRRRYEAHRPVHIYIYEKAIETLARDLLLLQVAFNADVPLRQRCNTFLEIFGNARVQERTSAYIEEQAKLLVDLVYNECGPLADHIDLSHLKMRSHDDLIDSFRSWFQNVKFDVDTLRDHRLRHYYEVRYDYRDNLIDWDYTMKLKKIENASVIHIRQYRDWRNSGVAFEFGDQTYTVPNRTMAAYTEAKKKHHGSVLCRGLWTDIILSPYISFGVHCEMRSKFVEQLFEIHNKGTGVEQNRHNTVEIAVYNVLSYLYEIETSNMYQMEKEHDIFSGIGDADDKDNQSTEKTEPVQRFEELNEDANQPNTIEKYAASTLLGLFMTLFRLVLSCISETRKQEAATAKAKQRAEVMKESLKGVKIVPLTGKIEDIFHKKRYSSLFDYVFVSSQQCHTLQPSQDLEQQTTAGFTCVLKEGAAVDIESAVFMLPLQEEQRVVYVTKLEEWAAHHSLQPTFTFGGKNEPSPEDMTKIKNAVLRFNFQTKEQLGKGTV